MRLGRHNTNRGQVLVLVAVAILGLLGALGLSTDIAIFYFNWAQLRKEVDAAALAGANYLPDNPGTATATAATWVAKNGQPGDAILQNVTGNLGYNGIAYSSLSLKVQRTVPYYFGKVVGLTTAPIAVAATAGIQPLDDAQGWIPIAMPCKNSNCYTSGASCTPNPDGTGCYSCGTTVTLNTSQVGPGDWEALYCPAYGPGEPGYVQGITLGCPTSVGVGDTVTTKPGNPNKTVSAINSRLATCPSCSSTPPSCGSGSPNFDPGNPRAVLLPLTDTSQFQGRTTAPVYGFAEGWIISASGNTVTVQFIKGIANAGVTPSPNAPNTGAFGAVLLQ